MGKFVFIKASDFVKTLNTSFNQYKEEHKKGLEELTRKKFKDLRELEYQLSIFDSYVDHDINYLKVRGLPFTIIELPVLYRWSPKAHPHGDSSIGIVKAIENS